VEDEDGKTREGGREVERDERDTKYEDFIFWTG
jgi:hypothetical protein